MFTLSLLLLPLVVNSTNPAPLRVSDDVTSYWANTREIQFENRNVGVSSCSYTTTGSLAFYTIHTNVNICYMGYIGFEDTSNFEIYISQVKISYDHYTNDVTYSNLYTIDLNTYLTSPQELEDYHFEFSYSKDTNSLDFNTTLFKQVSGAYHNVGSYSHLITNNVNTLLSQENGNVGFTLSTGNDDLYPSFNENIGIQLSGIINGTQDLYTEGFNLGYETGFVKGNQNGYVTGYDEGFQEGQDVDDTAFTIFNGILNIAFVPINFFLAIFNFEILGINITTVMTAILSICIAIIVVRLVTGKSTEGK